MPSHSKTNINYPLLTFGADIWEYTRGYHRRLLIWYTLFFISSLLSLLVPVFTAKIIDSIAVKQTNDIVYYILIIFVIEYSRIIGRNRIKLAVYKLAEICRLSSRQNWISQVLSFDLKWHDSQNSGKKISILSRGSDQLKGLIQFITKGGGGIDIFVSIVGIIFIFFTLNFKYAILCLINVTFYMGTLIYQTRRLNQKRHQINRTSDNVMGKNFDFFSNMSLIKSLGIGQNINQALFVKESHLKEKTVKYTILEFNKWIYINTVSQVCHIIAIFLVVDDILNQRISIGSFLIYNGYINRLQDGLGGLAEWVNDLIEKYLGLYRVQQLLHSGTTTTSNGHQQFPDNLELIKIDHLSFGYNNSRLILDDANLLLKTGRKYGFVGISGSGKSTLSKLLLKLYLPKSGSIYFNKHKITQINTDSIHQHISVAPQDNEIFNLSFKENITIASSNTRFNPELYDLAIKTAECQSILNKIKNNHQTILGEKGIKLSGGERQRLGIARAIYKNTPLIIFDESTSALDSKTEAKILASLEKYFASKTIIWIAHRLSTLRFTDEIIVFDQGKIIEQGSFKTLVKKMGHFYELWQIQKKTNLKKIS